MLWEEPSKMMTEEKSVATGEGGNGMSVEYRNDLSFC